VTGGVGVFLAALGDDALAPVRVAGTERLGEGARFTIDLSGPADSVVLPSRVLRSPCLLVFETESGTRRIAGLVTRFSVLASDHAARRAYRMTVESRTALLALRRAPRIFRDLSIPDVIERVARGVGYERFERRLAEPYPVRGWTVQYDETDLAFLRRLCEEHGLYFRFEEADGTEIFVLEDSSGRAPRALAGSLPIVRRATPSDARPFAEILSFVQQRRPGKVTLRDHDPERPALSLESNAAGGKGEERAIEVYEAPGGFRTPEEGAARAKKRLEALRADVEKLALRTNAIAVAPGTTLSLVDAPDLPSPSGAARAWFVVSVELSWEAERGTFAATVEATNGNAHPFRLPRVTPRPRIAGVQSAWVAGEPGQEIDPDALGRVRLAFHWDLESPGDRKSSMPVRVMQPEAPAGLVVPRVGWEVFVLFEDGDPERPVILGRSYNAKQPPPLPLPANKTVSIWGTESTPGAPARTLVQLDDAAGREHILLQAPFARFDRVHGDAVRETKKNENARVGGSATVSVGGKEVLNVHMSWLASYGSRQVNVAALQKLHTGGHFVTHVEGSSSVTVGGMLGERVGNPVKGAANLLFSAALAGVGTRGTPGAIAAAGAGMARAAVEGFQAGGAEGLAKATASSAAGVAASLVPGGEAILAAVTGSSKPMPWDHGRPAEGTVAPGGGAEGASGASGKGGPGPGHRNVVVDGPHHEIIGGVYSVITPGPVSWVTAGPSMLLVGGSHRTETVKGGRKVLGFLQESLGAQSINAAGNVARVIKGVYASKVAGPRTLQAGGAYSLSAEGTLRLAVGGELGIDGGIVTFKCGNAKLVAGASGVFLQAPSISISGKTTTTLGLTHR
jgi:type VI secretion system secreted protein VgrG